MILRPPGSTRTYTLFPYTTLFRSFRLSDDGAALGFMEPASPQGGPARMNVFVQALQGSQAVGPARRLTHETERDIAPLFWKGTDTVINEKDINGEDNLHVLAVNAYTGVLTDHTPFPGVRAGIQDDLTDSPEPVLTKQHGLNPKVFE